MAAKNTPLLTKRQWKNATLHLAKKDKILAGLIAKYPFLGIEPHGRAFETLFRAVVGQQISVLAADSVWNRLKEVVDVANPEDVLNKKFENLRAQGLSQRKVEYVRSLAEAFQAQLITDSSLQKMTDEEVVTHLCQIRGIGRWTSEMFLIFHLVRPNVFPWADIGLKKSLAKNYRLNYPLSDKHQQRFQELFSPYCTVAVWYLWKDLDPVPVHY